MNVLVVSERGLDDCPIMTDEGLQALIDDATYDFTMGEIEAALAKLREATEVRPASFEAWHAMAEILFNAHRYDEALTAADRAHALQPDDIFINTSLSRIWMERGDKAKAEHFGARARVLGWKDQLKSGG